MRLLQFTILLTLLFPADSILAQGSLVALRTGVGLPLQTESRSLALTGVEVEPVLQFSFGFATEEKFIPDTVFDSFTVTLQSSTSSLTAVCLAADIGGLLLAPPTPGGLTLDPATLRAQAIVYPSLQPVLPVRSAFQVSLPVPVSLRGGPVNIFFDLFDNLDSAASQGWFSDIVVLQVPEPRTWGLMFLSGLAAWCWRRCGR